MEKEDTIKTLNNYNDYTDEELFELYKDIQKDIEYNEECGICDSSEYDLYSIRVELIKRNLIKESE